MANQSTSDWPRRGSPGEGGNRPAPSSTFGDWGELLWRGLPRRLPRLGDGLAWGWGGGILRASGGRLAAREWP